MELRSSGSPITAEPAVKPASRRNPAIPASRRAQHVELDDVAIDRDAGAQRFLHVAADGIGVPAELGAVEDEHQDDTTIAVITTGQVKMRSICRSMAPVTSGRKRA